MENFDEILRFEERIIFQLRLLYKGFGYLPYKMNRFEEYDFYAENKAFLPSGEILTFTGVNGKLMALRPDVTLSIVKYTKDSDNPIKLYYNENVYRSDGVEFNEQMQVGVECIGDIDVNLTGEILLLAKRSLDTISEHSRLDISHMGYLNGLLGFADLSSNKKRELVRCISEKNSFEIKQLCLEYGLPESFSDDLVSLTKLYGTYADVADVLKSLCKNDEMSVALDELKSLNSVLDTHGICDTINIDFSIVNDINYYNGIIFQGYIKGVPSKVLSGGSYDELLTKLGRKSKAIGFAIYLNTLSPATHPAFETNVSNGEVYPENKTNFSNTPPNPENASHPENPAMLSVALPKGRLGEKAYAIFEKAGFGCPEIREESRKLVFENKELGVRYFWVKPSDVARYVERGAADVGVVGKDILLEYSPDVYELYDLDIGKCNISVAKEVDKNTDTGKALRVATKFPNITRSFYQKQGREIDIIELNGSIELAPLLGLSDVIVDIVETGQTLLENNLKPTETIVNISARLISNKTSYKFNQKKIDKLCESI